MRRGARITNGNATKCARVVNGVRGVAMHACELKTRESAAGADDDPNPGLGASTTNPKRVEHGQSMENMHVHTYGT